MKKTVALLLLLVLSVTGTIIKAQDANQPSEEFKPSGKPVVLIFSNIHNTFSDGKNLTSFEVTRAFFGYDYSFSKKFSARILYDATAQTVNSTLIMQGYLRNIYLQYDNGKVTLRGGIITPEQIVMVDKLWNFRYIYRPFIDINGMTFASDLGVFIKYKPSDMAAIDFSVTNGRGYKDLAPDSTFRYIAGLTLLPVKDFVFRGYIDMMSKNNETQWTMSLSGAYLGPKFTLGAEYLYQKSHLNTEGHDYSGFNIFSSVKLNEKFSLFGRFDYLFSEIPAGATEAWNITKDGSTIIGGLDYNPVKGVRLSPNLVYFIPDASGTAGTGIIGLNIEARF